MNTTTNKTLLVIIGVLLLTNIAVLVYFLRFSNDHDKGDGKKEGSGISEMLKKEVGFNEQQVAQYKMLKDSQWATIRPMFDDMRRAKDSLFRLLSAANANDSMLNNAADVIAMRQKALDLKTFYHFKKLRSICTPDQEPRYDSMVVRMFRKMGRQDRRGPNNREEKTSK